MTKINVTNSIIFVTDSIAMSHIDDMEDDMAVDLAMTWIVMMTCKLTWSMTWPVTWKVVLTWRLMCMMTLHSQPILKLGPFFQPIKASVDQFWPSFQPFY